jgi:small subunit ribosomal protein S8
MDPISDMLTRIKNAQAAKQETVIIPYSKFKMEVARALEKHFFVKNIERHGKKNKKKIEISLAYDDKKNPIIREICRISKQSRRVYRKVNELKPVRQGHGIAVLSTPKGVLSDKEAKEQHVGGEVICEVW